MNVSSTTVQPFIRANVPDSGRGWGLAVGLTLFFLLLVIVPGVIVFKRHSDRRKLQFGRRRGQKAEDQSGATPEALHHYTSMHRAQPAAHAPIYENLPRGAGCSRSPGEPEEDVYLQCDVADDAIYGNDPRCDLAAHPDSREEDVYVIPDSP